MKITGVIFFGDSVLAGTGASERELSCAKLVKDQLSIPVSLKGRNWNTSEDGLGRLEQDVLRQKDLSHVVVLFGNNDCWLKGPDQPRIPLEQFEQNMKVMINRILGNKQTPILCSLQLINSQRFIKQFPELQEYSKESQGNVCDIQKLYSDKLNELSAADGVLLSDIRKRLERESADVVAADGIHPNDLGHRVIAEFFLNSFKQWDTTLTVCGYPFQNRVT